MKFEAKAGVYPTMITPYTKEGNVDYKAIEALTEWYYQLGCEGIFADCQSSEILYLTLEERIQILRTVIKTSKRLASENPTREPMMIVASGHVSDGFEDQVKELNALAAEGPDAIILISNRMDIANTTDEAWIADTERLTAKLPADMPLGVYECPKPYKRLMSEKMLKWCAASGRFYFLKDTCCDAELIAKRLEWCRGSDLRIFNANAQTLLQSLKDGAHGYCGVMANIHPDLYCKLFHGDYKSHEISLLQDYLGLAAMVESLTYPCCAKYHLDRHEGIHMEWQARSADVNNLTPYQRSCIDQLAELSEAWRKHLEV